MTEQPTRGALEEAVDERNALLALIKTLQADQMQRAGLAGGWSVRDMLAHVAGWQEWMLAALPQLLEHGELSPTWQVEPGKRDEWNQRFVQERQNLNEEQLLEDMAGGFRRIMLYAVNLGATRLYASDPWPGATGSLAAEIRGRLPAHDREHRLLLERNLKG